jgi:hypothetical protein
LNRAVECVEQVSCRFRHVIHLASNKLNRILIKWLVVDLYYQQRIFWDHSVI